MPFVYSAFELDLSNRESALDFVRSSLTGFGLSVPTDAELSLELNAGTDADGVKVYRPYIYAATVLGRSKNTRHVNESRGTSFRDADKSIKGWLETQAGIDLARSLILPPGAVVPSFERPYSGPVRMAFRG